jgi:hypothetical protein
MRSTIECAVKVWAELQSSSWTHSAPVGWRRCCVKRMVWVGQGLTTCRVETYSLANNEEDGIRIF